MEVLLFTVFASMLLAAGFVAFFVYTQKNPDADSDRDSLLPLEDEHFTHCNSPKSESRILKDKNKTI